MGKFPKLEQKLDSLTQDFLVCYEDGVGDDDNDDEGDDDSGNYDGVGGNYVDDDSGDGDDVADDG